jgi:predicted nucleic acid-binding protein
MSLVVIADLSSLMALENIGESNVLPKLFSEITITPEVAREYGREIPSWIQIRQPSDVSNNRPEITNLDRGEASSIALALDSENPLLIIDEKKGRRVAERLDIEIIGTVGVLIKAKIAGYVADPDSLLARLEAVDFRLDDNLRSLLAHAGDRNS